MGTLGGLLTKVALVLAKVEVTPGTDAVPTAADDAILAKDLDYTIDQQQLERDFVSNDLSPFETVVGRIIGGMEFTVDVGGNGQQQSGLVADAPKLATLLRGCGFELSPTDGTGAQNLSNVLADRDNAATDPKIAWTAAGTVTVVQPVLYTVEVTTGGASGVAQVLVSNNNPDEDDITAGVPETITDVTPLSLGAKGGTIEPTWAGTLAVGQIWRVLAYPVGVKAVPRSTDFETLTLYQYRNGLLFKLLNSTGTFEITAVAGEIASITFNFSGSHQSPVDSIVPDGVFEDILPPQVQLALLTWGSNVNLTTEQWTMEMANEVVQRPDVNSIFGNAGSRIASRTPTGGFNPEATVEADNPFWSDYEKAKAKVFTATVGNDVGNQCVMFCPRAQTSEIAFGDRDGVMTYEKTIAFARDQGDDEVQFVFC